MPSKHPDAIELPEWNDGEIGIEWGGAESAAPVELSAEEAGLVEWPDRGNGSGMRLGPSIVLQRTEPYVMPIGLTGPVERHSESALGEGRLTSGKVVDAMIFDLLEKLRAMGKTQLALEKALLAKGSGVARERMAIHHLIRTGAAIAVTFCRSIGEDTMTVDPLIQAAGEGARVLKSGIQAPTREQIEMICRGPRQQALPGTNLRRHIGQAQEEPPRTQIDHLIGEIMEYVDGFLLHTAIGVAARAHLAAAELHSVEQQLRQFKQDWLQLRQNGHDVNVLMEIMTRLWSALETLRKGLQDIHGTELFLLEQHLLMSTLIGRKRLELERIIAQMGQRPVKDAAGAIVASRLEAQAAQKQREGALAVWLERYYNGDGADEDVPRELLPLILGTNSTTLSM